MNQRDLFYKWLFYSAAALLFLLIQGLILNRLSLWGGVHPFLVPLLALMPSTLENRDESVLFAVIFGFFTDLLMPGPAPGFYTLVFLAIAILSGIIAGRLLMPGFLCACVCSAVGLVVCGLIYLLTALSHPAISLLDALGLIGREVVLTLPFSPAIFWLDRKIYLRMRDL